MRPPVARWKADLLHRDGVDRIDEDPAAEGEVAHANLAKSAGLVKPDGAGVAVVDAQPDGEGTKRAGLGLDGTEEPGSLAPAGRFRAEIETLQLERLLGGYARGR